MPKTVSEAAGVFSSLAQRIEKTWVPHIAKETTFRAGVDWTWAALTPSDAISLANDVASRILELSNGREPSEVKMSDYWERIINQAEQIDFANFTSNIAGVARSTFEFLFFVQLRLPARKGSVDWDKVREEDLIPKRLTARLRALEARLTDLEPRSALVEEKILLVESAHDAAERLPTDLEELRAARDELNKLVDSSRKAAFRVDADEIAAKADRQTISDYEQAALVHVKNCEEAYRITTSAGLAGAFEHRSRTLAWTGWGWVAILIVALSVGGFLGVTRLDGFKALLSGDHSTALVSLNLLIAVVGVAAPVWLAWLATRSIGQSFRLSEDYAFKSAVSKAYEGYRKEAVNLDEDFARRLFGSALNRLDEAPSRFIVRDDHNSPLEALLANAEVKELLAKFPEFRQGIATLLVDQKTMISGTLASAVSTVKGITGKAQEGDKPSSDGE